MPSDEIEPVIKNHLKAGCGDICNPSNWRGGRKIHTTQKNIKDFSIKVWEENLGRNISREDI